MEDILVNFGLPVFICVVLPISIVWLVARTRQQETNKRAEIMLKAIEAGVPLDMTQFEPAKKQKANKSIKQDLLEKLNGACITGLMGIGFLTLGILRVVNTDFGRNTLLNNFWLNRFWLPGGCVLLAVGIGLFISYFVGKKMLAKEIEAEEKKLEQ
ncbi:MAG: hypothetical protein E7109_09930 [Bacteroidales bacterium]|jgi:hypothetical protein|nr:hypothetical protein [Bacteroidales bacterium]